MNLAWLDRSFLGEPVRDWMVAAAIAVVTLALLALIKRLIVRRVGRIAPHTETRIDDFLVEMVTRTRWLLLLLPVLYLSMFALHVPRVQGVLRTAAILAVLFQIALWALVAIDFWVATSRQKRLEADAASVTMLAAFGFFAKMVLGVVIFLLVLENLGVDVTALVAGLGVGGIAVALALQNILGDLFASLSIVLDKPFVLGDAIQVDDLTGTVESIGLKTTHLRSVSGEQLILSNGDLLRSRIRNHKRMGDRRVVLAFGVTYRTTPEQLERIPAMIREAVEARDQTRFDRAHFRGLGASSLDFEAVYFVVSPDYLVHMDRQQAILLDLLRRFESEGISLAYPTRTVLLEGAPASFSPNFSPDST
jgi:small-conductance mechanosensitive channel